MFDDARLSAVVASQPYPLVFVTISGAHLYGFPSPDSDYDLRGAHILPLPEVVGLKGGRETVEFSAVHDGLEIDLVSHDARKFFGMLLKRNGYVLEQVCSPLVVRTSSWHEELLSLVPSCITVYHAHHGVATPFRAGNPGASSPGRNACALADFSQVFMGVVYLSL